MAKRPGPKSAAKGKAKSKPKAKPRAKAAKSTKGTAPRPKPKASRTVMVVIPQHITLDLPPALHDRLKGLSQVMDLPMEAVVRQALMEFADTWEEHHRTVAALAEGSDRVQLAVAQEE